MSHEMHVSGGVVTTPNVPGTPGDEDVVFVHNRLSRALAELEDMRRSRNRVDDECTRLCVELSKAEAKLRIARECCRGVSARLLEAEETAERRLELLRDVWPFIEEDMSGCCTPSYSAVIRRVKAEVEAARR